MKSVVNSDLAFKSALAFDDRFVVSKFQTAKNVFCLLACVFGSKL